MVSRPSSRWLFLLASLALAASGGAVIDASAAEQERSSSEHPILRIAGSDSMASLLTALATEYGVRNAGFLYELDARGSGTAPPLLLRGEVQIAAMTRELNPLEQRAFEARNSRQPLRVAIALDAVAIIVNATNPIERLDLQQVDAIFSSTRRCGGRGRQIHTWGEVGVEAWANKQIGVVVTPRTSGTREYFAARALCGGDFIATARELPGARSVLHALAESPDGIGYAGRAVLPPAIKAVPLEDRSGRSYSATTVQDVRSGKYPLTRSLFLVLAEDTAANPAGTAPGFVAFVLSDPGQDIVERQGFLPLSTADRAEQRALLR